MKDTKTNVSLKDRSYQYSIKIIEYLDTLPKDTSTQVMAKQLLRSATSVGANITEAQSASSKKDFVNFYNHALKSANETVYWLNLLRDAKKINSLDLSYLINEAQELANILGASILTARRKTAIQ